MIGEGGCISLSLSLSLSLFLKRGFLLSEVRPIPESSAPIPLPTYANLIATP
jgi:hypothetical protein